MLSELVCLVYKLDWPLYDTAVEDVVVERFVYVDMLTLTWLLKIVKLYNHLDKSYTAQVNKLDLSHF